MDSNQEMIFLRNKLERHIDEYRLYILEEEKKEIRMVEAQELTNANLNRLIESTQGLVNSWTFAMNFQKFIKWLSGFAIIGAFILWVTPKVAKFFSP